LYTRATILENDKKSTEKKVSSTTGKHENIKLSKK